MDKSHILSFRPAPPEPVSVPEWKDELTGESTVYVMTLNGLGLARLERLKYGMKDDLYLERLLVCTLCDANGNLIFEGTEDEVKALSQMNGHVLMRIFEVAYRLNVGDKESIKGN
jgi:hypothetical protein